MTFYEYGFTNFAENSKILSKTGYNIDHAIELVLNKDFYVKLFGAQSIYHFQWLQFILKKDMEGAHGIIRIDPIKADMDEEGGLFHRMHLGVHITVNGEHTWMSGLSEDSGHKCHW